jgi:DNA-binding HxlR family transcriptional regulator
MSDQPCDLDDAHGQLIGDVFDRGCPAHATVPHVASKWGMLALLALRDGDYRFNALRRRVSGVSEKMLAQTLQMLERDGLVRREVITVIPARVEYSLSPLGGRVADTLHALAAVLQDAAEEIAEANRAYDAR